MAIVPETRYSGKITPGSPSYPYGQARNITVPGDGTGTPFEEAWLNDVWGMLQYLLTLANVTPTGSPETALESQYYQALQHLGVFKYDDEFPYSAGEHAATSLGVYRSVTSSNTGNDPDADDGTNWDALASAARDNVFSGENTFEQPVTIADAENNNQAAAFGQVLGHDQTWQDLTVSRSAETVYTNDTGRAIVVSVAITIAGTADLIGELEVDGLPISRYNNSDPNNTSVATLYAIVPPGSTYEVQISSGSVNQWVELRS